MKRMFYTGLYHTLLEPVDRTGENPGWTDYLDNDPSQGLVPYYDDFYAIWDLILMLPSSTGAPISRPHIPSHRTGRSLLMPSTAA